MTKFENAVPLSFQNPEDVKKQQEALAKVRAEPMSIARQMIDAACR